MQEYFEFRDLKALIIGITGGLILLGLKPLWLLYTERGAARRLRETEAYRAKIETLAGSNTALLIYGFQGIFAVTRSYV